MEKIIIDGFSFLPQQNNKNKVKTYYQGWVKIDGKPIKLRLHQYVWIKQNGLIPKGFHIHHIDGNIYNNDISNLQCVEAKIHNKIHWDDRKEDVELLNRMRANLNNIRHLTKEWHSSEEGKQWHRDNAKVMWQNKQAISKICECCSAEYETKKSHSTRFCSNKCKSQQRRNDIKALKKS